MNPSNENAIIRATVAASIEIIASNTTLRVKAAKSTFNVSPEDYRLLDVICRLTGKTKQKYFASALQKSLKEKTYLNDIPIEKIKELSLA